MTTKAPVIKRMEFDDAFEVVRSVSPIIKNHTLTALEKAKKIIAQASADAAVIRQRATDVLKSAETEKEEERKRGYEEGLDDGQSEFTEKILEAELAHEKILAEAEPQIVKMVMDISEKVIGQAMLEGAVVDVVKKAISESVGRKISVRIHPADINLLKERQSDLMASLGDSRTLSFLEDESIPAGGCIVEKGRSRMDSNRNRSIESRDIGVLSEVEKKIVHPKVRIGEVPIDRTDEGKIGRCVHRPSKFREIRRLSNIPQTKELRVIEEEGRHMLML